MTKLDPYTIKIVAESLLNFIQKCIEANKEGLNLRPIDGIKTLLECYKENPKWAVDFIAPKERQHKKFNPANGVFYKFWGAKSKGVKNVTR